MGTEAEDVSEWAKQGLESEHQDYQARDIYMNLLEVFLHEAQWDSEIL